MEKTQNLDLLNQQLIDFIQLNIQSKKLLKCHTFLSAYQLKVFYSQMQNNLLKSNLDYKKKVYAPNKPNSSQNFQNDCYSRKLKRFASQHIQIGKGQFPKVQKLQFLQKDCKMYEIKKYPHQLTASKHQKPLLPKRLSFLKNEFNYSNKQNKNSRFRNTDFPQKVIQRQQQGEKIHAIDKNDINYYVRRIKNSKVTRYLGINEPQSESLKLSKNDLGNRKFGKIITGSSFDERVNIIENIKQKTRKQAQFYDSSIRSTIY